MLSLKQANGFGCPVSVEFANRQLSVDRDVEAMVQVSDELTRFFLRRSSPYRAKAE